MNHSNSYMTFNDVGVEYIQNRSLFSSTKIAVLKGISFDIRKGESIGIIGRNGAGKSTLLKIISGIIKPDRGKVVSNTKSVSLLSLQVGFEPNLSGIQNIILSGMLLGFTHKEVTSKISGIIDFSELNDFINRPVKHYSSGMLARLGFSIAIQLSPDIILIDEVLSVGDASFQAKSLEAMRNKIASDQTVVLVSHDGHLVKELCDRVLWIENGVVKRFGDGFEVVNEYESCMIN